VDYLEEGVNPNRRVYSIEGGIQKKKRTVDLQGYNQTDETTRQSLVKV